MFSTAGALDRTLLKIRLSRTDMKTLTTNDLRGLCPGTLFLSPGHGPRDMNNIIGDWKAIGQKTTHPDLGRTRTASNPETQTAQDDPCAQMAVPTLC